jgi:hypothetical protein
MTDTSLVGRVLATFGRGLGIRLYRCLYLAGRTEILNLCFLEPSSRRRKRISHLPLNIRLQEEQSVLRACLKSRMRGHVIVGVMTISTDVEAL